MCASPSPTIRDDVQLQAKALGDPTRFRIFRYLFDARRPVGVAELTNFTMLNHNAVRQHLDVLARAGLVSQAVETERTRPGRPRLMYTMTPEVAGLWGTPNAYEYLATLLSEAIRTGVSPEEVARATGRRRGKELTADPGGSAVGLVAGEMARIGFRPSVRRHGRQVDVVLERCPFASAAAANPGEICGLHRGLAEGLTDACDGLHVENLITKNPHRGGCRLILSETTNP